MRKTLAFYQLFAGLLASLWVGSQAIAAVSTTHTPADSSGNSSDAGDVDVVGLYGRGFDFWSKAQQLNQSSQSSMTPADIAQLFDSSFDHPQEGIASFMMRYHAPVNDAFSSIANLGYFGVGVDALAGGTATNRILPEVQAYGVYTGHIDYGFMQRVPERKSGWEYRVGSTVGVGKETLIEGSAVDLLGNFAPNDSALFYTGLDLDLGYRNQFSEFLKQRYSISLSPTLFHSDFSNSDSQYAIQSDQINLRWRETNEWSIKLDSKFEPDIELGVLTIMGQQPTPITFLPRTWDAVHDLDAWPSAGQLIGLGTRIHLYDSSGHFGLLIDSGFYGGYLGASSILHVYGVQLAAGTFGLEETSGYRIAESRIEFLSIGCQIAL
jgi:hypothetical protein